MHVKRRVGGNKLTQFHLLGVLHPWSSSIPFEKSRGCHSSLCGALPR